MKQSKKVFSVLVVFIFLGTMLYAGGGSQGRAGATKTLDFWHAQTDSPQIKQGAVDRFIANNPGYKVNVSYMDGDSYEIKLAVAMNSGILPDVFFSWSGGKMISYTEANLITDLTPYMNANNYKNKFLDAALAQATYDRKIWGVPAESSSICVVFYNKDIFSKYNLKEPATLRELEAICDTLVQNRVAPFALGNKARWPGSMYFMYFVTRYAGLEPFSNATMGKGSFTHPAFIYAGKKIQEWVNKKYFLEGFNSLDTNIGQDRQPMYNGDAAMVVMGSWLISQIQADNPGFAASKLGFFMWPKDESGINNTNAVVGTVGDNFYHISQKSTNKDKAFELITHLNDDKSVQDLISIGKMPPVKGITLTNPLLMDLTKILAQAKEVQLWYDQSLSPEVSEVHKDTCQELFGLTITPEVAAQRWQDASARYLSSQKR